MLILMVVCSGLFYFANLYGNYVGNSELILAKRLSDPSFDATNPMLAALDSLGSSNRIQVTVKTEVRDNLHPKKVDLDQGYLNLIVTATDGTKAEYTLQNARMDNFESGCVDHFTLVLPDEISVMDTAEFRLTLMPTAKGAYGTWSCEWAQISFLLGGERTLLAKSDWTAPCRFSKETPAMDLTMVTESNLALRQARALYPHLLSYCKQGNETVHTYEKKAEALKTLGIGHGDLLYLDVETVSLENQSAILVEKTGSVSLPDTDRLNYDGTMTLRVRFLGATEKGFYVDYPLDNPGKDDFELGSASTFAITMPSGFCVFDIVSMELLVQETNDAWAPRMMRAYLKTDYATTIELARTTDVAIAQERGTNVFYKGLIETKISPIRLDLTASYQTPSIYKEKIEGLYLNDMTGVEYGMYFNDFDYYERQILFYSQLSGGNVNETA